VDIITVLVELVDSVDDTTGVVTSPVNVTIYNTIKSFIILCVLLVVSCC
jgi:hypothetical protein